MSWRDELRPASFRGVVFDIIELGGSGGRRVVADECPETDILPPTGDLGASREVYRIRGFVTGDDYLDRRDRILLALRGYGPGELLHPWRGRMLVQVRPFSWSHDSSGGACTIDFECVEHGGDARPFVEIVPEARAQALVASANAGAAAYYGPAGALSVRAYLDEFAALDELVAFGSGVSISDLVTGSTWNGPLADAYAEALQRTADIRGLLAYARTAAAAVWHTLGTLRGNAIQAGYEAMTDGLRAITLIRVVELATAQTYTSADEAERVMSDIAAELSAQMTGIEDYELFVTLSDLRTSMVDALTAAAERLPRERTITIAVPTPSIVVAFDTYGARRLAAREAELVKLNQIGHPGFVVGPVRVLS